MPWGLVSDVCGWPIKLRADPTKVVIRMVLEHVLERHDGLKRVMCLLSTSREGKGMFEVWLGGNDEKVSNVEGESTNLY